MKRVIDNQIAGLISSNSDKIQNNPTLFNQSNHLIFRWPSLLEYLGLGSVLLHLPEFGPDDPVFIASVETLSVSEKKEVIYQLYDQIFAEILSRIKALPQINASFLLQTIKHQRKKNSVETSRVLSDSLDGYETALTEKSIYTMHDLILYLAWDRMCVCMAKVFDYQSTDPKFIKGIRVIKECLVESYEHIKEQGRTAPGIYRMLESFLFYEMREENLDKLSDTEWAAFSKSFQFLKRQDALADYFYIDDAVVDQSILHAEEDIEYLVLDAPDRISAQFDFISLMMDKLKSEFPSWKYALLPKKVISLNIEQVKGV